MGSEVGAEEDQAESIVDVTESINERWISVHEFRSEKSTAVEWKAYRSLTM